MLIEQLSRPAKRLIKRIALNVNARRRTRGDGMPRYRRYLSNRPQDPEQLLKAAGDYVSNLARGGEHDYLYLKPYDPTPGNRMFFIELYQIMNILQAMDLPGGSRVLEVGCGPGWVTEVLALMGFEIDALDPSQEMIDVAQVRLDACRSHHHLKHCRPVRFHCQSLEACDLPDETFDAVLFHESLHHIVDELAGLKQVFRMLCPGGIIGVSGEGAWRPGNRVMEQFFDDEMERFGVLENPFTVEYLDYLLEESGFESVTRYEGVNGLFPVKDGGRPLRDVAMFPATDYQSLTARKPDPRASLTTQDRRGTARGELTVLTSERNTARRSISVTALLKNCGDVTWNHSDRQGHGYVTLALRQGPPGTPEFREAAPRTRIPQSVQPGASITVQHTFLLPDDDDPRPWTLDLVNEQHYWFSNRGTVAVDLETPQPL